MAERNFRLQQDSNPCLPDSGNLFVILSQIFLNFASFTSRTRLNQTVLFHYRIRLLKTGCVKSYSAKFVRNHFLIRYSLHCDWLLLSTDLKGHSRLR